MKGKFYHGSKRAGVGVAKAAYKALRIAVKVGRMVNAEKKLFDNSLSLQPSTSGAVQSMVDITQGLDRNNRIGRSIKVKSIQLRGRITQHATAAQTTIRLIFFTDGAFTGTPPTAAQLMVSDDINSLRDGSSENLKRFKILSDRMYQLSDVGKLAVNLKWFKKMDLRVIFTDVDTSDEGPGSIWLYHVSDEATNVPTLTADVRIRYYDN